MKHNKELKFVPINTMLDPKLSMTEPPKDDLDEWAKNFCLSTILTGTKKMVSQETTIEFNESVVQGVKGYHNTVLKDVAVNKWKVVPPPKVLLDYNNIPKYEKALLTSYRESPDPQNPYFSTSQLLSVCLMVSFFLHSEGYFL